jgi:hypothetical protein
VGAFLLLLIPAAVAFGPAFVVSRFSGDVFRLVVLAASPLVFLLAGNALFEAQPLKFEGGDAVLVASVAAVGVGWELGLLAGWARAASERLPVVPPPR